MRKIFTIFISITLCLVICLTSLGCSKENTNGGTTGNGTSDIEATEFNLVNDGKTDYTVVYPEEASSYIITAMDELDYFFNQATGITLTRKPDSDVSWTEDAKYISLGETTLVAASNAGDGIVRKDLNITGYAIKTVGKSVFLIGGRDNGVINAVYRFLNEQFNFECYAADEIALDTNVKNEKLLNYDVKDVPDIAFNATAQNELMLNPIYARRLGMSLQEDWIIEMGGSYYHNWLGTIPKDKYEADHSNWYSPSGLQLCLTRDKEGLAAAVLEEIKKVLLANPSGYAIGFTQEDDAGWCDCDSCKGCKAQYGSDAASQILFMNYLWDILEPWLEVTMPDREVYLYMFAYQNNTDPPKTDSKGNLPEEMKLNEHIYVQLAPIYAAGYQSYGYKNPDGTDNSVYDAIFKGWSKVTDNIMVWSYSFYYKNLMYPYYDFADIVETHKYLTEYGTKYLFDEDHSGLAKKWSDFSRLKFYLRANLVWDNDCDLTALTEKFFVNYYKDASATMKKLFDEYSTHYSMLIEENNLRGQGAVLDINEGSYWPKGILDNWMRLFDQAFADIEHLKATDYDTWSKLEERIRLDSISLRYLCEQLYGSCVYVGNGNTILQDCQDFGISYLLG